MKTLRTTNQFLRDLKRARKRGWDMRKIESVIDTLVRGETLAPRFRLHTLRGDMEGLQECHIEPDWLLIWEDSDRHLVLTRTGTHADLFG